MIRVVRDKRSVEEYKTLLRSDWTDAFTNEVMGLLWRIVSKNSSAGSESPLMQILDPENRSSFPIEYFRRDVLDSYCGGWKFVRVVNLPELPSDYGPPDGQSEDSWLACRLSTYLTFQAITPVEGDVGFLADVQALAFQAAIHTVLPRLRKEHPAEHSILLHAVTLFSVGYIRYDPDHCAYMLSQVYDYLDEKSNRLETLLGSFRVTSLDDHSFLTRAQECWSEYLDRGQFDEAEQFLFSLHLGSSPEQRKEVQEMIVQAIRYILKNEKRRRRATA